MSNPSLRTSCEHEGIPVETSPLRSLTALSRPPFISRSRAEGGGSPGHRPSAELPFRRGPRVSRCAQPVKSRVILVSACEKLGADRRVESIKVRGVLADRWRQILEHVFHQLPRELDGLLLFFGCRFSHAFAPYQEFSQLRGLLRAFRLPLWRESPAIRQMVHEFLDNGRVRLAGSLEAFSMSSRSRW